MWVSGNTMNTGAYLSFSIVQYCHVVDLINISKLGDAGTVFQVSELKVLLAIVYTAMS